MEVKVSLVIKSHLNDAMDEIYSNPELAQSRLGFVKYLIHMFPDTDVRIDIDEVYTQYEVYTQSKLGNK